MQKIEQALDEAEVTITADTPEDLKQMDMREPGAHSG